MNLFLPQFNIFVRNKDMTVPCWL